MTPPPAPESVGSGVAVLVGWGVSVGGTGVSVGGIAVGVAVPVGDGSVGLGLGVSLSTKVGRDWGSDVGFVAGPQAEASRVISTKIYNLLRIFSSGLFTFNFFNHP